MNDKQILEKFWRAWYILDLIKHHESEKILEAFAAFKIRLLELRKIENDCTKLVSFIQECADGVCENFQYRQSKAREILKEII